MRFAIEWVFCILAGATGILGCDDDETRRSADENALDAGGDDTESDSETESETEDEDCAGVSQSAQNSLSPVDIIIAVDNSGSMTEEAVFVQQNMNGFSEQISGSGVNAHIVLISKGTLDTNGICVDPPLGSGDCPADSNPPTYLHLPREVGSSDALIQLSAAYPAWRGSLRVNSVRHIVIVSDDNSMPFATAQWFINTMGNKNPPFDDFTAHAIVSSLEADVACGQDPPHACCELSASRGTVYEALVNKTGGVLGDLCAQDFQPVFDELAKVMSDVPIACEWELP
ncbi:MAG: VWA domain-containing protein, partial [Proteobacteria bacterium]|nr:VWA domain-containing protein [Pseudomonadota bacterium]